MNKNTTREEKPENHPLAPMFAELETYYNVPEVKLKGYIKIIADSIHASQNSLLDGLLSEVESVKKKIYGTEGYADGQIDMVDEIAAIINNKKFQ